jgi:hypothetical protein
LVVEQVLRIQTLEQVAAVAQVKLAQQEVVTMAVLVEMVLLQQS